MLKETFLLVLSPEERRYVRPSGRSVRAHLVAARNVEQHQAAATVRRPRAEMHRWRIVPRVPQVQTFAAMAAYRAGQRHRTSRF